MTLRSMSTAVFLAFALVVTAQASNINAITFPTSCNNGAPTTPPCNDVTTSLGSFRLRIDEKFTGLFMGYPGFSASRLNSPVLFDPNTMIGRSDVFGEGTGADAGAMVGANPGNIISDSMLTYPFGFSPLPLANEVHT